MNKNFYQVKKQREDWVNKNLSADDSLIAKGIKNKLFKRLKESNIDLKGKRIVQLGCVSGYLMESLIKKGAYVHAVDFSKTMMHKSHKKLSPILDGITNYQISPIIRDFSILSDFAFDIVIAVTMLEHLPEDMAERIIEDAKRLLKEKTGIFIFRLPLSKKHETVKSKVHPHQDYNIWTHKELAKIACKYRYKAVDIDDISIFYKGSNQ